MIELYVGNDNLIELVDLTNAATDVIDTTATVGCRVRDRAGADVPGQTFPFTLTHLSAGKYQGILSDAVELRPNRKYVLVVTAQGSSGETGLWELEATAKTRGG